MYVKHFIGSLKDEQGAWWFQNMHDHTFHNAEIPVHSFHALSELVGGTNGYVPFWSVFCPRYSLLSKHLYYLLTFRKQNLLQYIYHHDSSEPTTLSAYYNPLILEGGRESHEPSGGSPR